MRSLNIAILSFAILLRILVGIHPHSGQDDYQGGTSNNDTGAVVVGENKNGRQVKYGGDYEAQRHWMEITYHLPMGEWYYHDLDYWGLDYPPLTAYVSWLCGWAAHNIGSIHDGAFGDADTNNNNGVCQWDDSVCIDKMQKKNKKAKGKPSQGLGVLKDLVALHSSRWGFEESGGKLYMRFTVLIFDLLIYISAVWVLVARLTKDAEVGAKKNTANGPDGETTIIPISQQPRIWLLLTALSQPALVLIDHGHFQYNTVSLGLALWSFHFMTLGASFVGPVLGSILFSLALNFKQMELYHAPAIFAYLLGRCFRQQRTINNNQSMGTVSKFCALGVTVILTFAVLWVPFALYPRATSTSSADGIMQIVKRLFPFNRGIFEGKVANLWCALSVKPFSIRNRLSADLLPLAALGLTFLLILPPCWILFKVGMGNTHDGSVGAKKSKQTQQQKDDACDIRLLLWGATSTSLAFFLASFQVHEKGIIIALAPISLLALDAPHFARFFSILATWSLWPLLVIDRLSDAYICCLAIYLCIDSMASVPLSQLASYDEEFDIFSDRYISKYIPALSWVGMILMHIMELVVAPPDHLPDLYPVLWSFVGCGLFCISYLATIWAMAKQSSLKEKHGKRPDAGKKAKSKIKTPPISLLGLLLMSLSDESFGFVCPPRHCHKIQNAYNNEPRNELNLFSQKDTDDLITPELLEQAKLPLSYEVQNAREAKPVLNLSARNSDTLSLADGADFSMSPIEDETTLDVSNEDDYESWEDGHIWQATEQDLMTMGILLNDDDASGSKLTSQKVLTEAPQLLRLPTPQVIEAATFLLSYPNGDKNSTALIEADPSLLTYWADDLQYGVEEYLANMMFMGNQTQAAQMIQTYLAISPTMAVNLVKMGVSGGLEERHISRALSDASKSSGKAVEGVVGEAGRSYREWKRMKGGKGSLG